jgi:hypothetical protein
VPNWIVLPRTPSYSQDEASQPSGHERPQPSSEPAAGGERSRCCTPTKRPPRPGSMSARRRSLAVPAMSQSERRSCCARSLPQRTSRGRRALTRRSVTRDVGVVGCRHRMVSPVRCVPWTCSERRDPVDEFALSEAALDARQDGDAVLCAASQQRERVRQAARPRRRRHSTHPPERLGVLTEVHDLHSRVDHRRDDGAEAPLPSGCPTAGK